MGGPARSAMLVLLGACLCALEMSFALGTARAESVFTVAAVPIDAEAASAAEARELAIAAGQRAALETLLRRLTVAGSAVPAPEDGALAATIAGFAIDRELVAPTRYRASLTVDFHPPAVRALLRGNGVPYAETVSKPVLVVAVQRGPDGVLLWEDHNRWRQAWEERPAHGGLVPLLLPLGDVIDLGTVDATQAVALDGDSLTALADLYGVADVAVAVADISWPGDSKVSGAADASAGAGPSMTLRVGRIEAGGARLGAQTLAGGEGEPEQALFARGIERVVAMLEDNWKAANLIRYDRERTLRATVPIASLGDWVSVQRRLANFATVAAVEIESLSRRAGRLTLRYHGEAAQLRRALEQADLILAPTADGWMLQPRGAVSAHAADGGG